MLVLIKISLRGKYLMQRQNKTLAKISELKAKQDKIVKLKNHDLDYFLVRRLVMMIFKICLFINQRLIY